MSNRMTLQDGDYFELPWGQAIWHNNELHLVSAVNDPAGVSFLGGNGCKVSWKDAGGMEKALLQLRQKPNGDGEFYLGAFSQERFNATRDGDRAMIEISTLSKDGIEFRVPVKFSAGFTGGAVSGSAVTSPDGRFVTVQQNDGNFVTYDTARGPAGDPNAALWSSFGGFIQGPL